MPFEDLKLVNPWRPVEKHRNFLPHWQQDGAAYILTFHLGDSLPRPLLDKWTPRAR